MIIMGDLCRMSWDIFLIHLLCLWYQTFRSPSGLFMQQNELKHSVCSNWKIYMGYWLNVGRGLSLYDLVCVGGWACVCRQWGTDAERCALIFVCLWRPCWTAVMSYMCQCSSQAPAYSNPNGMITLSISHPPLSTHVSPTHSYIHLLGWVGTQKTLTCSLVVLLECKVVYADKCLVIIWK